MTKSRSHDHVVIGVDPGPWTGVCILHYGPEFHFTAPPVLAEVTATGVLTFLRAWIPRAPTLVTIGYETFVVGRRAGRCGSAIASQVTREVCGQISTLAADRVVVVSQSAGVVAPWCSIERLTKAGLLPLCSRREHALPAAKQAVYTASRYAGIPDPLSKRSRIRKKVEVTS